MLTPKPVPELSSRTFAVKNEQNFCPCSITLPGSPGLHHAHFVEFRGQGPPTNDIGSPGDVYFDTQDSRYGFYARQLDNWEQWCRSVEHLIHPYFPSHHLVRGPTRFGCDWIDMAGSNFNNTPPVDVVKVPPTPSSSNKRKASVFGPLGSDSAKRRKRDLGLNVLGRKDIRIIATDNPPRQQEFGKTLPPKPSFPAVVGFNVSKSQPSNAASRHPKLGPPRRESTRAKHLGPGSFPSIDAQVLKLRKENAVLAAANKDLKERLREANERAQSSTVTPETLTVPASDPKPHQDSPDQSTIIAQLLEEISRLKEANETLRKRQCAVESAPQTGLDSSRPVLIPAPPRILSVQDASVNTPRIPRDEQQQAARSSLLDKPLVETPSFNHRTCIAFPKCLAKHSFVLSGNFSRISATIITEHGGKIKNSSAKPEFVLIGSNPSFKKLRTVKKSKPIFECELIKMLCTGKHSRMQEGARPHHGDVWRRPESRVVLPPSNSEQNLPDEVERPECENAKSSQMAIEADARLTSPPQADSASSRQASIKPSADISEPSDPISHTPIVSASPCGTSPPHSTEEAISDPKHDLGVDQTLINLLTTTQPSIPEEGQIDLAPDDIDMEDEATTQPGVSEKRQIDLALDEIDVIENTPGRLHSPLALAQPSASGIDPALNDVDMEANVPDPCEDACMSTSLVIQGTPVTSQEVVIPVVPGHCGDELPCDGNDFGMEPETEDARAVTEPADPVLEEIPVSPSCGPTTQLIETSHRDLEGDACSPPKPPFDALNNADTENVILEENDVQERHESVGALDSDAQRQPPLSIPGATKLDQGNRSEAMKHKPCENKLLDRTNMASSRIKRIHLDVVYHTATSAIFCRLCLQKVPVQVVEYPLNIPSTQLVNHCADEHPKECEALVGMPDERVVEISRQVTSITK